MQTVKSAKIFGLLGILVFLFEFSSAQWVEVPQTFIFSPITGIAAQGNIMAIGTNNGLYVSENAGTSFSLVTSGIQNLSVSAVTISGNNIILGTTNGKIYHSVIGLYSWSYDSLSYDFDRLSSFFKVGNVIWANFTASCKTFYSTDDGNSWILLGVNGCFSNYVSSNNLIFHGGWGTAHVSSDNGQTWTPAGNGYNAYSDYALMGADELGHIVLSRGFWSAPDASDDPLYYANAVLNPQWQLTNSFATTMHGAAITSFAGFSNFIFAGVNNTSTFLHNGVHYSIDGGQNWYLDHPFSAGVTCLFRDGNTLYVGLQIGQIWKRDLVTFTHMPELKNEMQNIEMVPVDGNRTFKLVNYDEQTSVTLLLYDQLGKQVYKENHHVNSPIQLQQLPNGIYMINVISNGISKRMKLILS